MNQDHQDKASGYSPFVFGVDLDGVCADFYGRMREIVAEWRGVSLDDLPSDEFKYGLAAWGVDQVAKEYPRIHRFAVTQRRLFETMPLIPGSAQALRRLCEEGVHIRIITHRLFIPHFHEVAVQQTVGWLDRHGVPYNDLCFIENKSLVDADVYVEDTIGNIEQLQDVNRTVVTFTNPTNVDMDPPAKHRADTWGAVETFVRERYYATLDKQGRERPPYPGHPLPV